MALFLRYDISKITERIYVGSQINNQDDVDEIKALGITHIIDAQAERSDTQYENFPIDNIAVLWAPTTDDGQHKGVDWFKPAIDFAIAALSSPGNKLLCHCAAGIATGPSLAYAVMRAQGLSQMDCVGMIHNGRPQSTIRYRHDADIALQELKWI